MTFMKVKLENSNSWGWCEAITTLLAIAELQKECITICITLDLHRATWRQRDTEA